MISDILDNQFLNQKPKNSFRLRPVLIWLAIIIIGVIFKINHYPGHALMILIGSAGLEAYAINELIWSKWKHIPSKIISCMGLF